MKDINVYMYISNDKDNKYASVYSESGDGQLTYNRTITTNNMDEKDVYGYLFGLVGRYIAPFIKMGDKINFFASQDGVIKEFEDSKLKNVGKIEKCEKNLSEISNNGFLDTEFRSLRDFDMARQLAGFGRHFSLFPFHPFDYLDAALEAPMRLMFDDAFKFLPIPEKKTVKVEPKKETSVDDEKKAVTTVTEAPKAEPTGEVTEKGEAVEVSVDPVPAERKEMGDTDWFDKLSTEEKVQVLKDLIGKL